MRIKLYLIIIFVLANMSLYSQVPQIELNFARKPQQEAQLYILTEKDPIPLNTMDKNIFINNLSPQSGNAVNCTWTILIKLKKYFLEIKAPSSIFDCNEIKINIETKERFSLNYCGAYAMTGFYQKTKIKKGKRILWIK